MAVINTKYPTIESSEWTPMEDAFTRLIEHIESEPDENGWVTMTTTYEILRTGSGDKKERDRGC